MSNLQGIRTITFDKNMNLILHSDSMYETLFGGIKTLTEFNTFLAKNTMLDEKFLTKLNIGGKEYHVCYKTVDLEDIYEFHFFLLSDDWVIVNPTGRHDIYDQLTGLLTERSQLSLLIHEIKRASRNKEIFTALIVDISHLKDINEAFGYLAGDSIIKSVADTLRVNKRGSDSLGRFKGDKFIILLHQTDMTGTLKYIQKFEKALRTIKFHFDDLNFYVKTNYGITVYAEDDSTESILNRLQSALDTSKEGASSHIEYFT